jgi:hypothetical protein
MKMKNMSVAVADSILSWFPDPDDIPYKRAGIPFAVSQNYRWMPATFPPSTS